MAIGERLREARMRQRVDVSEVERVTKIRAKYLRALENEEFDLLPGPTFVKTFLRTYGDYLGLDSRLLVEEYSTRYEPTEDDDFSQPFTPRPPRQGRRHENGRGRPSFGWLVGGALVGLLALFLVIGLLSGDDTGSPSDEKANTQPANEPRSRDGGGGGDGSGGSRRRARSVTLRIAPTDATYACLDHGPGTPVLFEGSLTGPRTFRGRRLRLNLGRPSATVRANGRRVDTGGGSEPVGFTFVPNRAPRPLPIGQRPCA